MRKSFKQLSVNNTHRKKISDCTSKSLKNEKNDSINSLRVSPPILPIQYGIRHEQMPVLRQGIFIQFESSQKMNGVFVALLLRERHRSTIKKKTDGQDSDSDNQSKAKKDQSFQFQTEARAVRRQQQTSQPTKPRRRSINTTSPNRRSKSTTTARDSHASVSTTQLETKPVQAEPKELSLSERLAAIGRISNPLDTTQD